MITALLEGSAVLALGYALLLYACMWMAAWLLLRSTRIDCELTKEDGRYGSIDALRGLLASGVLVHHSFTAFTYFNGGGWHWSESPLFNHLGQTTVALFFMITGFLFSMKATSPRVDWKALYLSRLLRLFPLHSLVVVLVFGVVFASTGGTLQEPPSAIAIELFQWLTFDRPDINKFPSTWTLIAGVNWTIRYEFGFYLLCVPLLHLLSRVLATRRLFSLCIGLLAGLLFLRMARGESSGNALFAMHFVGGTVTALAYRLGMFNSIRTRVGLSALAFAILPMLLLWQDARSNTVVLITLILFAAIVGGASLMGLLRSRPAVWLGDISYGIYLLHGIVLWSAFKGLKDFGYLHLIGPLEFISLMVLLCLGTVLLASLSYARLEAPAMRWARARARNREGLNRSLGMTSHPELR